MCIECLEKAENKLREMSLSVTMPRKVILAYLMNHYTHPTIDTIYSEIHKEYPSLSLTTVYNTVQALARENAIQILTIDGQKVNVDGNTIPHGHLICRNCGHIIDIPLRGISSNKACKPFTIEGHRIEEVQQYYKGLCKECMKKTENINN